jgi:hypothetical protein
MKLLTEVLAGAAACGIAYYVALPNAATAQQTRTVPRAAQPQHDQAVPSARSANTATVASPAVTEPSLEQQNAMATLRNEVSVESSRDMQARGQSVVACLAGIQFAGAEKLRFSVAVASMRDKATIEGWQFVEVAEGEPVPESFASCASNALGKGQRLAPPKDLHFPDYRGGLSILYTIPAAD